MKFLRLKFIPQSVDFALLVLRLWFGLTLFLNHGWAKVADFGVMRTQFPDLIGIGSTPTLALAAFAEFLCAALVALGFLTRFAALVLVVNMGTAFFLAHGHQLSGAHSGELAFMYLGAFVTLFFAGAGKFSVDARSGGA